MWVSLGRTVPSLRKLDGPGDGHAVSGEHGDRGALGRSRSSLRLPRHASRVRNWNRHTDTTDFSSSGGGIRKAAGEARCSGSRNPPLDVPGFHERQSIVGVGLGSVSAPGKFGSPAVPGPSQVKQSRPVSSPRWAGLRRRKHVLRKDQPRSRWAHADGDRLDSIQGPARTGREPCRLSSGRLCRSARGVSGGSRWGRPQGDTSPALREAGFRH